MSTKSRVYDKRKKNIDYHRQVWIEANGPIPSGMVVHHINHDKLDNRLENLMLMTHQEHSEHHNQKHPRVKTCEVCGSEFTPHPTKRARAKTCGMNCARVLMSRAAVEREAAKRTPLLAEHVLSAVTGLPMSEV